MKRKKQRKHIEYKKIALALIVLFSLAFISIGRIAELFGAVIDSAVDVALVYCIIGAFASYCIASATDKYGMNKYGVELPKLGEDYEKEDGTE